MRRSRMWCRALSRASLTGTASHAVRRRSAGLRSGCRPRSATTVAASCVPVRGFTSFAGFFAAHHRCPAASSAALRMPRRTQSTLQKLLDDPHDPYLAALQEFDIPRIAAVVEEGPAQTAIPEAFLQRLGLRTASDVTAAAATRAEHTSPTPVPQCSAASSAEAVLQSLHGAGAARQHEAAAAAAVELQSAQAAYDALPSEEKAALQLERLVSHLFDGVCAINAAIRVQAEDEAVSPDERDAVLRVCARVARAYEDGTISAERWAADFAPEMKELDVIWRHLGDPRPLPAKM